MARLMAKKKKEEVEQTDLKRENTELHVTLGLIRGAVSLLEAAVESKDKDAFKDALKKLKVHTRQSAS